MKDSDYRDRYQRKLSKLRSKYRRRIWLVFIMALVLGFLIGWIVYGRVMDDQWGSGGAAIATSTPTGTAEPTGTPAPTWFDEAEETGAPTEEPTAEATAETTEASGLNEFFGGLFGGSTEAPTEGETAEPTDEAAMADFMSGGTETPTAEPTAEVTAEPGAETTVEPTAEPTEEPTPEPTAAAKGSKENPIFIGEACSFTAQVNADGTKRTAETDEAYFDLPITVTLSRYLLPDYYEETYATQYQITGTEAGAQLDIDLGAVDGLDAASMQDVIFAVYEDANGQTVQGYKFTDAEIGAESQSVLQTGASGTIYKRFQYDEAVDLKYLTLTYYYDLQPVTLYFSLTESILPEETPAPTVDATSVSYSVGSSGEGVKELQQKLIDLGYLSGNPDGEFGKYTEAAVMAAQEAMGLEETGVADAAFLEALNEQ